ncbi:hypothetical protein [Pedobacter cryophilus]|uniref:Uncharacterized protein n=1 Tax=Pedobacter cryophilus TaxID=2571271 RepID=A0A4U1C3R1_9SPHI|nr:hypothetical protein [Pedobacter cryophilus]TKB98966.1 hypothetical protein FA046_07580 [Pedobacter cryophilus]
MNDPKNKKNLVDEEKITNTDEEIINNQPEDEPINDDEFKNSENSNEDELKDEPILPEDDDDEFF